MKSIDMIRIEKSSDLIFPESAKIVSDVINGDLESKSGSGMKSAVLGGIASGIAFFGVTAIVDRVINNDNDNESEELLGVME